MLQFNENDKLKDDVMVPTPGEKEVLVRVKASSCHTDYRVYQGVYGATLPFTGSHEPAGTVAALESNLKENWKVGDRIDVLKFRNPCESCPGCRWRMKEFGSPDARFCGKNFMAGISGADGSFA
jgi:D-arabinose 1-dehydrogenase-like Zn-dependent alcohol dehydrogenase